MEHPAIYRTRQTGYPDKEAQVYGTDALGNEVYVGNEIYIYEGDFWLVSVLSQDAIEVLEFFGAKKIKARFGL